MSIVVKPDVIVAWQRLDKSEKELVAAKESVKELESQNATFTARVKYIDKNMQDLEFLLEHAVQREEKALQREKQALAALTKSSSENAHGQGLPHEIQILQQYLCSAEQHCSTIEVLLSRCSNATAAKDAVMGKLRKQLDRSEEELQVIFLCPPSCICVYTLCFEFADVHYDHDQLVLTARSCDRKYSVAHQTSLTRSGLKLLKPPKFPMYPIQRKRRALGLS